MKCVRKKAGRELCERMGAVVQWGQPELANGEQVKALRDTAGTDIPPAVQNTMSPTVALCDLTVLRPPFAPFPGAVLNFPHPGATIYLQLSSTNSSQRERLNRFNVLSNKLFPSSFTHVLKDKVYFFSFFSSLSLLLFFCLVQVNKYLLSLHSSCANGVGYKFR